MKSFHLDASMLEALGWTIIHSLWIVTTLALALFGALRIANKASAQFRYGVSLLTLALSIGLTVWTFSLEFNQVKKVSFPLTVQAVGLSDAAPHFVQQDSVAQSNVSFSSIFSWIASRSSLFAQVWLLGVFFMSIRFAGSCFYLYRLNNSYTSPIEPLWVARLELLSLTVGLSKFPEIKSSRLISTPLTLGFLKPVILLPFGMLEGLSTQEVEAILAHELYHIKRHDFLINIFQSVIEIFMFYHPGIWWMSKIIREEREHCCDDRTVALTGNPLQYAKALTLIQEQNIYHKPLLSMAATQKNGRLSTRIYRLFQVQQKQSGVKSFVSLLLLAAILCAFSFLKADPKDTLNISTDNAQQHAGSGSVIPESQDAPPLEKDMYEATYAPIALPITKDEPPLVGIDKRALNTAQLNFLDSKSIQTNNGYELKSKKLMAQFRKPNLPDSNQVDSVANSSASYHPDRFKSVTVVHKDNKLKVRTNASPLYIIDGSIVNSDRPKKVLADLDPNQVSRIQVIRGERSVAMYGEAAKEGAVIIFTKGHLKNFLQIDSLRMIPGVISIADPKNHEKPKESVSIYPNPSRTEFKVDFEVLTDASEVSIVIYDNSGAYVENIHSQKYKKGKHAFEYLNPKYPLKQGIYVLEVKIADQIHHKRLLIE